jgi:aminoglycoside phosphotransferase (APT) family kinase protein
MTLGAIPPSEVAIDASVVRGLLQEQHTDLAHLVLVDVGEGWDNRLFRLGDDLAVRLPRRAASAALIEHEQRWLPLLAPRLPLPIPVPVRLGRPGRGFPWSWNIVRWFTGQSAALAPPEDPSATAVVLGRFLRALHQPAPLDAPHNPWRGIPLAARAEALQTHLQRVNGFVDRGAVLDLWTRVLSASPWSGPPLWIHGDLHPGNLLVDGGGLSAVIDFGDLAAGDPATDLSVSWMLLPASARASLFASARGRFNPIDDDTRTRARGWALALGLAYLANSLGDEAMRAMGQATIDAALNDSP